jgi:DNA-nicking Smr family endonuclease
MIGRGRRDRRASDAELELWQRAVSDTVPITKNIAATARKQRTNIHVSDQTAIEPALPSAGRATKTQPIDRNTLARLKKGRIEIEGRLDLHGLSASQAEQALHRFLLSSHTIGRKTVLVITGRGLNPDTNGPGILKRETPLWLDRMPEIVSSYAQADRRHGGEGALYVRLRRKKRAIPVK